MRSKQAITFDQACSLIEAIRWPVTRQEAEARRSPPHPLIDERCRANRTGAMIGGRGEGRERVSVEAAP